MEGVEDIPGTALAEGIDWSWETFPEYLDALDGREFGIDIGLQVSHGAVRAYAMGERGAANEPASPDEIAAMAAIVQEAVEAGALGFSTSRTLGHRAMDGRPVPGTFAAEDELFALGSRHEGRWPRGVRARAARRVGRGPARTRAGDGVDGQACPTTSISRCRSRCSRSMPPPTPGAV